ncbi:MarR family winged helix-turn-helix transcriptional regulator [Desulfitobacterium sp. AusDCA]|uniref:MarR family winged helix-turn-helix transcriptional regulator n=1 Tax=Desulfitobacterium sp. AusDCA TaxID=3240383 RepID=UPI003DA6EF79
MDKNILDIYNLIQELSWFFGNQGFDGECCGDLSLVEFMAVKKIQDESNITIQEIGNSLNITKGGASKIVDRLETKGYVLRKRSSIDGRVCCVCITNKGIEVISKILERYTHYVGETLKGFEPKEIKNIKDVLEGLINSIRKQGFIKPV